MNRTVRITESDLKRAVEKSINRVLDKPKRGWGDIGDHSTPERGYYYCEESDYSSGRVRRWIGDENDARICRMCSEGGAYGPFNSRSDAVNFMKHFDKDYRERYEKIYGKPYDGLDESKIRRIVKESVKRVLKEGTQKQNAFLRKLMGDRYLDEYDNLSPRDTSALIDKELQSTNDTRKATDNQVNFLVNNKYHKLPWVEQIRDRLTFEDASEMCDVVSPYQGRRNYHYNIRTRKEDWIPMCVDVTARVARKYGLEDAAAAEEAWLRDFQAENEKKIAREENKRKRIQAEKDAQDMKDAKIVFVSSQDGYDDEDIDAPRKYDTVSLYDIGCKIYMHGDLESAMGWDIVDVLKGYEGELSNMVDYVNQTRSYTACSCRVEGYDKPCRLRLWYGYSDWKSGVIGVLFSRDDRDASNYAYEKSRQREYDI